MTDRRLFERSLLFLMIAIVFVVFLGAPGHAQTIAGELDDLKRAIEAGQPVKFSFRFNSMAADSPKSSGIYACCGMPAVYMADGTVTLTDTAFTFDFSTAVPDFTIAPDKIVEFTSQPGSSRVQLTVMLQNKRGKEVKKTYYLYNPETVGSGDPSVGGPGASISCVGCDRSMDTLARLVGWVRTRNRSAPSTVPKLAESGKTGMTNEDVVKLAAAGLSEQVIATAIRQERTTSFDLSPAALIALKSARVPDGAIAAMQEKKTAKTDSSSEESRQRSSDGAVVAKQTAASPRPASPCAGLEMMGLYKVDMRPASPLIVYQAKVRNGTSVTRIVTVGWQDFYGTEKQVSGEVSSGQIATFNLGPQAPRDRQPINLRVKSCE